MKRLAPVCTLSVLILGSFAGSSIAQITEIIDANGDSGGNMLNTPEGVATDASGNVFVTSALYDNAFKITPGGVITEIIDANGDSGGNILDWPEGIATDASGNVFVTGNFSDNVFKITPGGVITEIIDANGDGVHALTSPQGVATDASGNVFVVGVVSDNVFKITPAGAITEIIDATGDGVHALTSPQGVATDASGNVFVAGYFTDNVFRIATPGSCSTGGTSCTITEIIDAAGSGGGLALNGPIGVTTDASGNVFVAGETSSNVFKIATPGSCSTPPSPSCTITEILDATGDGAGNIMWGSDGIATDASDNVFVTGYASNNAFKIATPGSCSTSGTPCTITEIIDASGDGGGNTLNTPLGVATDTSGTVFVAGTNTHNVFKIALSPPITVDIKVFLEGAYQPGTNDMSTAINGILPLSQPYDSTLFDGTQLDYDGLESVGRMSTSMVDWVLVQLRKGDPTSPPMPVVAARAALLKSDGTIVDLNGTSAVRFTGLAAGDYYVVIFHRNHLGVITPSTVALSSSSPQYNFATASSKAFGTNPMKEVETGVWGLYAAEADVNGLNNANDFNLWLVETKAVATGYIQSDFDLDGQSTASDFNLWLVNTKAVAVSRVP